MGKLIKKVIALLLVMGLCISNSYVINVKAEDLTDRVLTSDDIPDETLYNLMLGAGDNNGKCSQHGVVEGDLCPVAQTVGERFKRFGIADTGHQAAGERRNNDRKNNVQPQCRQHQQNRH